MSCWTLPLLLLLLLAGATLVKADSKIWRYNTNYSNPDNWSLKRIPCPLDRVVFPAAFRQLAVLLPEGTTELRELVLPPDGEFILPKTGQIYIGERSTGKKSLCTAGENVFTRTGLKDWLDPESWVLDKDDPEAVPHLERIPCLHDTAVFPDDASIGVLLPLLRVSVYGVKFGSLLLTENEWWDMLRSEAGWRFLVAPEVRREEVVHLRMIRCADPAGCVCLPDNLLLQELICINARTKCEEAGQPPCYDPVIPHGHCCAICGSYLQLNFDRSVFSLQSLRAHVQTLLNEEEADNVKFHVSRVADDRVQVMLVDRGTYKGDSVAFADKLYSTLRNNLRLGVTAVQLFVAGSVLEPDALGRQIMLVFGTLMATICLLGGVFLVFVVYRDRLPLGLLDKEAFVFARFENVDADTETVEVVARPPVPRYDQEDDDSLSKAFDNPMYGKSKGDSRKVTHENPVYSELKKRVEEPKGLLEVAEMKEMPANTSYDDEQRAEEDLVEIDIEEQPKPTND